MMSGLKLNTIARLVGFDRPVEPPAATHETVVGLPSAAEDWQLVSSSRPPSPLMPPPGPPSPLSPAHPSPTSPRAAAAVPAGGAAAEPGTDEIDAALTEDAARAMSHSPETMLLAHWTMLTALTRILTRNSAAGDVEPELTTQPDTTVGGADAENPPSPRTTVPRRGQRRGLVAHGGRALGWLARSWRRRPRPEFWPILGLGVGLGASVVILYLRADNRRVHA